MFYHNIKFPKYCLDELLKNADDICNAVAAACPPQKMFEEYLRVGFYYKIADSMEVPVGFT